MKGRQTANDEMIDLLAMTIQQSIFYLHFHFDLRKRKYVESRRNTCITTRINKLGQMFVQIPSTPYEAITVDPGIGHSPVLYSASTH